MRQFAVCVVAFILASGVSQAAPIDIGGFSGSETLVNFDVPGNGSIFGEPSLVFGGVTFTDQGTPSQFAGFPPGPPVIEVGTQRSPYFDNISGASLEDALNDNAVISNILIEFASPVNRVGVLVSASPRPLGFDVDSRTWELQVFDAGGSLLESVVGTMPPVDPAELTFGDAIFLGIERPEEIAFARIVEIAVTPAPGVDIVGGITLLDDLRFETLQNQPPGGGDPPSTNGEVPEPTSIAVWGIGALGLALYRRRRAGARC